MADVEESFFVDFDNTEVPSSLLTLLKRLDNLKLIVSCFRGWDDEVAVSKDSTLKSLSNLKQNFEKIRCVHQLISENLKCQQKEESFARYLRQKTEYICNNIPDKFNCGSGLIKVQTAKTANKLVSSSSNEPCNIEQASKKDEPPSKMPKCNVPEIFYLTVEEFDKTPKYLKGRITYEKINGFIDTLNKVISSKYAIFKKKKSTLKKKDADLWNEYNKQELKETKGLYFCVADDFRNWTGSNLDKTGLGMLTILRHCGRIRELRSGGLLRYVAMF